MIAEDDLVMTHKTYLGVHHAPFLGVAVRLEVTEGRPVDVVGGEDAVYDASGRVPLEKLPNILLVDDFQSFATNAAIDLNRDLRVPLRHELTYCDHACVDLSSDPAHCGSCTAACGASQVCQDSACVTCSSNLVNCNNKCVDLKATGSNWNCGRCNNVCSRCINGECMDYGRCGAGP